MRVFYSFENLRLNSFFILHCYYFKSFVFIFDALKKGALNHHYLIFTYHYVNILILKVFPIMFLNRRQPVQLLQPVQQPHHRHHRKLTTL